MVVLRLDVLHRGIAHLGRILNTRSNAASTDGAVFEEAQLRFERGTRPSGRSGVLSWSAACSRFSRGLLRFRSLARGFLVGDIVEAND